MQFLTEELLYVS